MNYNECREYCERVHISLTSCLFWQTQERDRSKNINMAFSIATLLTNFKKSFNNQTNTIRNVVILVLVFAFEALISGKKLFRCPAENYTGYSTLFFVVPTLSLLFISLFLSDSFWKIARGCCHYEAREKQGAKKYCCCFYPRWKGGSELLKIVAFSSISSCLWLFWAFLQEEYFVCAKLGLKTVKLKSLGVNATAAEKKQLEEEFVKAHNASSMVAWILLAAMLSVPFSLITIHRCCFQRPESSIPSPYGYQKLEAKAAVARFKEKMEQLAQEQGKRKAELYFSHQLQQARNPSELLERAYNDLTKIDKFNDAFTDLDDYKIVEAEAAASAFMVKVQNEGKETVELTFKDQTWNEYEIKDGEVVVQNAYEALADRYPRMTGDRTKPYLDKEKKSNNDGVEMHPRA